MGGGVMVLGAFWLMLGVGCGCVVEEGHVFVCWGLMFYIEIIVLCQSWNLK